jgi:hypothetical protein
MVHLEFLLEDCSPFFFFLFVSGHLIIHKNIRIILFITANNVTINNLVNNPHVINVILDKPSVYRRTYNYTCCIFFSKLLKMHKCQIAVAKKL